MRRLLTTFLVLANIACGVSLPLAANAPALKLHVGYPSHGASMYPLYVTKEARLLEKHGLDAEMIFVQGVQLVQVHVAGRNLDQKGINFAGDAVWSSPLTHLNSSTQGTGGFIDTLNHRFNVPHQVPITIARPFSQVMVTGTTTPVGNIAHVREDHQPLIRDAVCGGGPDTSKRLWRLSCSQRTTLHRVQPCFDG